MGVTGSVSVLGLNAVNVDADVLVGLNETDVTAPAPGTDTLTLLAANASSGPLSVGLTATAAEATSFSNVDGDPGVRITNGYTAIEDAGINIGLGSILGIDLSNLVTIALTTDPADLFISQSNITGDGDVGMLPTATSNLLATNSDLSIAVLGINLADVSLAGLVAGVEAIIDINVAVNIPLVSNTSITGTITLLADSTFEIPDVGTDDFFAFAEAIGLQIGLDLSISQELLSLLGVPTAAVNLGVTGNIVINETSALMLTPEPAKAVLLVVASLGLLFRRRRCSATGSACSGNEGPRHPCDAGALFCCHDDDSESPVAHLSGTPMGTWARTPRPQPSAGFAVPGRTGQRWSKAGKSHPRRRRPAISPRSPSTSRTDLDGSGMSMTVPNTRIVSRSTAFVVPQMKEIVSSVRFW